MLIANKELLKLVKCKVVARGSQVLLRCWELQQQQVLSALDQLQSLGRPDLRQKRLQFELSPTAPGLPTEVLKETLVGP